MPSALLRPCLGDGGRCPELVASGRCPAHTRQVEQRRGSAHSRGYTSRYWVPFRARFSRMLLAAGIAPVCGASLPGGPSMAVSRCKAEGLLNNLQLELHHDPPLTIEERKDHRIVCNPLRVGWLCRSCHSAETRTQMNQGRVG
jgi:hypothetical protein